MKFKSFFCWVNLSSLFLYIEIAVLHKTHNFLTKITPHTEFFAGRYNCCISSVTAEAYKQDANVKCQPTADRSIISVMHIGELQHLSTSESF